MSTADKPTYKRFLEAEIEKASQELKQRHEVIVNLLKQLVDAEAGTPEFASLIEWWNQFDSSRWIKDASNKAPEIIAE